MSTLGKLLLGVAVAGAAVGGVVLLARADAPSKRKLGVPTRVLQGSGALVFGEIADVNIPGGFDPAGNHVQIAPDCSSVLVGRSLWTYGDKGDIFGMECQEPADGKLKTALDAGSNLCGYIDYLMNQEGITSSSRIGAAILRELNPTCIDKPSAQWPEALRSFVGWLREHVNVYVGEAGGEMDW